MDSIWQESLTLEQAGGVCIWSSDGDRQPSIRWSLKLIDWMRDEVVRESGTERREVGGLLLGTLEEPLHPEGRVEVSIRLFVPVPTKSPSGSRYRLTDQDHRALRDALSSLRQNLLSVVGIYRTDSRNYFELDSEDQCLAQKLLARPEHLFLVIQPEGNAPRAALFFPLREGHPEKPAVVFPFDRHLLSGPDRNPSRASKLPPSRSLALRPYWLLGGGIAVLAAFAALSLVWQPRSDHRQAVPELPVTSREPSAFTLPSGPLTPLILRWRYDNNRVELLWHPKKLPLDVDGLLFIRDGAFVSSVPLNSSALRVGSFLYYPISRSATFRLSVGNAVGDVTVAVPPTLAQRAQLPVEKNAPPAQPVRRPQAVLTAQVSPAASRLSTLPTAPDIGVSPNLARASVKVLDENSAALAPPPATPPPITAKEGPQTIVYVAPQSVHSVQPKMPANVGRLLTGVVTVRVKVQIDRAGNVSRADSLSTGGPLIKYLASASESAARSWRFSPARSGGATVSSELILRFDFAPEETP